MVLTENIFSRGGRAYRNEKVEQVLAIINRDFPQGGTRRSDQPIKDDQASALWQNWLEGCSENACFRSIDGVTTQTEEDPIKCKTKGSIRSRISILHSS
jgi:hypothetical protein